MIIVKEGEREDNVKAWSIKREGIITINKWTLRRTNRLEPQGAVSWPSQGEKNVSRNTDNSCKEFLLKYFQRN